MKVYIGPFRNYIGPYQIATKILFWKDKEDRMVINFARWLEPLTKLCNWIYNKRERSIKIKIDHYDSWNVDHTLAYIITPLLKQLKETTHGSPFTDDEDVPEELRSTTAPPTENEYDTDDNFHKRWEWILGEMIFAFESKITDWEEQFDFTPEDMKKRKAYEDRISNGFRLFGKYYNGLWD